MRTLILDFAGAPYDGETVRTKPIGGSELANVQLAEALAEKGHKIHILVGRDENQEYREINGVSYGHKIPDKLRNVILSRMTPLPVGFRSLNKIVSLTDQGPHRIGDCDYLVGVSRWQLDRFRSECRGAHRRVIPPIVEPSPKVEKVPHRYIYASASMKGLKETLTAWDLVWPRLDSAAHLVVCHGGWGAPDFEVKGHNVTYLGAKTPEETREEIAKASALFYVNAYPETFCAIAAVAEAAGTRPFILCEGDPGGLPEAINEPVFRSPPDFFKAVIDGVHVQKGWYPAKNYSKNKVVQAWENILT